MENKTVQANSLLASYRRIAKRFSYVTCYGLYRTLLEGQLLFYFNDRNRDHRIRFVYICTFSHDTHHIEKKTILDKFNVTIAYL